MKLAFFACLPLCLTTLLLSQSTPDLRNNESAKIVPPISAPNADSKVQGKILDQYGKLPLSFEANHGQTDGRVKFLSRTSGYSLFLTGDEAVLTLNGKKASTNKAKIEGAAHKLQSGMAAPKGGGVLRMKLRNANPAARVTGVDELAGTSNYFIGNDPTKWQTNVPTYAKVKYEGIYSGIDLVYYGNQRQLEYDFIVAPGADPRRIAFDVSGAQRIRRDVQGDLVFKTGEGEIRWHRPVVYQEKDGARQEIAARYTINDTNRVGFQLAKYDASRPLYIDPLIYSTYLGGSGYDYGNSIAVDAAGNAYVTGYTGSTDFPITPGAFQTVCASGSNCEYLGDAFVSKINAAGSALVYSTYLGGTGYDSGASIAVDSGGNAYITGSTQSTDFPITPGAFQTSSCNPSCDDAFVTKIDPTGSALVYSTYLGGSKVTGGACIAVDSAGNAYVVGSTFSSDFPTKNPLQPNYAGGGLYWGDAFVSKFDPTGSALVYSTYLGGSTGDGAISVAVDSSGNAYVTGVTTSTDFPTKNALQPNYGGGGDYSGDVFVAKINAAGSALVYSTYLGGSGGEFASGIAVDSSGNAYVTGFTASTDFPTKNALQPANAGKTDVFVTKFNSTGSAFIYSTYLGGKDTDDGYGIAADSAGNAYVVGLAGSRNFPVTTGALQTIGPAAFVTKVNPTGSGLVYSTYFGGDPTYGIAVDSAGNAYLTGATSGPGFPLMNPLQPTIGGAEDAFVTKMYIATATTTTVSSSLNPSIYGQAVTFTAVVTSALGPPPNGETVSFVESKNVLGTATLSGGSASFTTSTRPAGTHPIKAVYGGDASFIGSTSKVVNQVVNKATTTTTLASSRNPSSVGQSVTFTASVTPQFSGTVKGTVTFYDGAMALKTMALSGGVAKFTTSTLTSGAHNITATYNGSANFVGSSASLTQTVN
jgi:hypothetical protein